MKMIAIIDYDAGNLKSVEKALQHLGEEVVITRNHDEIEKADKGYIARSWCFWRCNGKITPLPIS